ncbi:hypothetical protein RJ640_015738, partial [Escallonia rubra]
MNKPQKATLVASKLWASVVMKNQEPVSSKPQTFPHYRTHRPHAKGHFGRPGDGARRRRAHRLHRITFKPPLPEVVLAHRYKKPHTPHNIVYFKLPAPSDPLALEFSGGGCGVGLGLGWGYGTAFGSQYRYRNSRVTFEGTDFSRTSDNDCKESDDGGASDYRQDGVARATMMGGLTLQTMAVLRVGIACVRQ